MIELRQLRVCAGGRELLGEVSCHFADGRLVSLLGRNGSGKSTLLRVLAGRHAPSGGVALIDGRDVCALSVRERALRLSVVDTERRRVPAMTVRELVALGRAPHTGRMGRLQCTDRCVVDQALERCGIISLASRTLTSLSDGELQRARIATALAQEATTMLLDEPTSFLDPPGRAEVMTLLRRLAEQGLCVLLSTHEVDLAASLSHVVAWIDRQRLHTLPAGDGARQALNDLFAPTPTRR